MALSENETLEYKRQYTPDIKKEVVAFANIVGGTVYIGTDDDGTSVGVHTGPGCRGTAACQRPAGRHPPGRNQSTRISSQDRDGRPVVAVGVSTAYYLTDKGLRPPASMCGRASARHRPRRM